ncbi:CHAT domain-containing protein [Actinocrispum wychmicini]|uniref:CHAT domain-containing protein n=1 Tax=Actinocrispum wychmicini TaxID=1213861 RepID=A0A4R2IQ55_9PSEU|nr:CHAT domain-containing protein [Actinocrispum wychmicini]TCO47274.1 CHAT domain-containing protein [Actinocrispum wychmicini]
MRDELVRSLQARTAAAAAGDPGPVLADEALVEAERLQEFIFDGTQLDLEVLQAVGVLHSARWGLLGDQAGYSPRAATVLLRLLYLLDRNGVPEGLWPLFDQDLSPGEAGRCHDLAMAIAELASVSGKPDIYPLAVGWLRLAVDTWGDTDDERRLIALATLADLTKRTYFASLEPEWLDQAIEVLRQVRESVDTVPLSLNLAEMLHRRFDITGDHEPLTEEIALLRAASQSTELDDQARTEAQIRLASALLGAGERSEAMSMTRRLLDGPADRATGVHWHNLSVALSNHNVRTGEPLADAIESSRRAVTFEGTPATCEWRAHLAMLLARAGDLDDAVTAARMAMAECPPDSGHRQTVVHSAGLVLFLRYRQFGVPAELDEAIVLLRTVQVSLQLGAALRERYALSPDLATLTEAIQVYRRILGELPRTHDHWPQTQANLSVALVAHYRHTDDEESLAEAVDLARNAVAGTPAGHTDLGLRLMNLGAALGADYERTEDPATLREELEVGRRAVAIASPGTWARQRLLANLGATLFRLGQVTDDPAAFTEAVDVTREAIAATPAGDPNVAFSLLNHAVALIAASEYLQALRVAQAAAGIELAAPSVRLRACRVWGQVAAVSELWDEAAAGFGQGVRLLPLVAPRNLRSTDIQGVLSKMDAVHVNAAASAIWADDPDSALELLEQGRGILSAYELDSRTELTDLRAKSPKLADEMTEVLAALDVQGELSTDQRHALQSRWTSVLGRIRELKNFEHFLEPPSIKDFVAAAEDGPVITVNVSEFHCAALVLTTKGVQVVPLGDLSLEDLETRVPAFLEALRLTGAGDLVEQMDAQAYVRETLSWLWNAVTGPILDALGYPPEADELPRVWWSPTGLLNFLPLHAAGDGDQCALDRVVSSYTPSIRALIRSRSRPPTEKTGVLAVAVSPGEVKLPAAHAEAESLVRMHNATPLFDENATHENVLKALPAAPWAHFACHAHNDPATPGQSRLLLHDRPLRVPEISRLRMADAELAYLSACSTASGTTVLADEAIHIVSAFQLAGYRHVVGTLWSIQDTTATSLADGFYTGLDQGMSPARSLHTVVRRLRQERPLMASDWAGHIHVGP